MKIIKQSHEVLQAPGFSLVELAGRTCYKSEDKIIAAEEGKSFASRMWKSGHHAMIEFAHMTVKFITDRGVTYELVRHRLCSFAQESTRYCNYEGGVTFIEPSTYSKWSPVAQSRWCEAMNTAENAYQTLVHDGLSPQQARAVLPNSTKTEIIVKANMREWMHIFDLRTSPKAHPDMVALMTPLYNEVIEMFEFLAFEPEP